MAGGILGNNNNSLSRWHGFLSSRGHDLGTASFLINRPSGSTNTNTNTNTNPTTDPNTSTNTNGTGGGTGSGLGSTNTSFAPPRPSTNISTELGLQEINSGMKSIQRKIHIQEALAAYDANASNTIFGNETSLQKTNTTIDTNIDTGGAGASSGRQGVFNRFISGGNENHASAESEQRIEIAQIGRSEEGGVANNTAYFIEDNTQLGNTDSQNSATSGAQAPNPGDPLPNFALSYFSAVQGFQREAETAVNSNRRNPIGTFANATSQLSPMDREALGGIIRQVGKAASGESRQAGRALYALARMVGTGADQSSFQRAYQRLEDALQPMDPNVGYDYNARDSKVLIGAVQSLVNYLPNFIVDDPELIGEIQLSMADIANSLAPGGNSIPQSQQGGFNAYA